MDNCGCSLTGKAVGDQLIVGGSSPPARCHGRVAKSPPGRLLTKPEWSKQLNDWHYLGATCCGVIFAWGHDEGCCVYNVPRSRMISRWFPGLKMVELSRMVGAPGHAYAMTSLMAESLREAKHRGFDVAVTYADPIQDHTGCVYKAGNWVSDGFSSNERVWFLDGKRISRKGMYSKHGTQAEVVIRGLYKDRLSIIPGFPKPRFLMGLTRAGRKAVAERYKNG